MPKKDPDLGDRLVLLETGFSSLASNLNNFVTESRDWRKEQGEREAKVWAAITNLGERSRITWPVIFTAVGVLVGVIGGVTQVAVAFNDQKFKNQETVNHWHEKELERLETEIERKNP